MSVERLAQSQDENTDEAEHIGGYRHPNPSI